MLSAGGHSRAGSRKSGEGMEDFRTGDDAQRERLRQALRVLYNKPHTIKSSLLARLVEKEARRLNLAAMHRTNIDKFRKHKVTKPRDPRILTPLWNVVFDPRFGLPTADRSEGVATPESQSGDGGGQHEFFQAAVNFFNADSQPSTNMQGRFVFYRYSEYFYKYSDAIPNAVVVGQWDIDQSGFIKEKQEYDGRLGRHPMREDYQGYCLPKSINICLLMREAYKNTPKFYVLEELYDDPETVQTVLLGYMLKASPLSKFFRSPVYAVRVPDDEDVKCNILRCEEVPQPILYELEALEKS